MCGRGSSWGNSFSNTWLGFDRRCWSVLRLGCWSRSRAFTSWPTDRLRQPVWGWKLGGIGFGVSGPRRRHLLLILLLLTLLSRVSDRHLIRLREASRARGPTWRTTRESLTRRWEPSWWRSIRHPLEVRTWREAAWTGWTTRAKALVRRTGRARRARRAIVVRVERSLLGELRRWTILLWLGLRSWARSILEFFNQHCLELIEAFVCKIELRTACQKEGNGNLHTVLRSRNRSVFTSEIIHHPSNALIFSKSNMSNAM